MKEGGGRVKCPYSVTTNQKMYYSVEQIEEFIRNEMSFKTADPRILRSWYKYANATGKFNLSHGHAPCFCKLAKIAGQNINEEFGYDAIKKDFYGIWKNNEINNPGSMIWEPGHISNILNLQSVPIV